MYVHCAGASGPLSNFSTAIKTHEFQHVVFAQFSVSLTFAVYPRINTYSTYLKIRLINF